MISKVKEYREMYEGFEQLLDETEGLRRPIQSLEKEIDEITLKRNRCDYNNKDIVVNKMEQFVEEETEKKKSEIAKSVDDDLNEITDTNGKLKKTFDKAINYIGRKKVSAILAENKEDFDEFSLNAAYKNQSFNIASICNRVLAFVFRFDFLAFFPKVLRIVSALIVWGIVFVPKVVKHVYNAFDVKYHDYIYSLQGSEYEEAIEIVKKELVQTCIRDVAIIAVVIILLNIVIYIWAKYQAKNYFSANKMIYVAMNDPQRFKNEVYSIRLNAFTEHTVKGWQQEISNIRDNGLPERENFSNNTDSICELVRGILKNEYDNWNSQLETKQKELASVRESSAESLNKVDKMASMLQAKETEVGALITDAKHNDGVLTSYVSLGFSINDIHGARELVSFKHSLKPMLICYGDDSASDGERLRKNIADIIERFMTGFYQENSHTIINMWLVDFEGLHFPESRTKGLMTVVRSQHELQELINELQNTRKTVDSELDGRIYTINPKHLLDRENPIHYNIVFFVGADIRNIDKETVQLFISGENFGFLPIVFLKQNVAQEILNETNGTHAFSKVLQKSKDNEQVYGYEGIIREFEYGLMVSDQKRALDSRVCVDKILSFDEFWEMASADDGLDLNGDLYVDTYGLKEDLYNELSGYDFVRYFTINGNIPEFVATKVHNL